MGFSEAFEDELMKLAGARPRIPRTHYRGEIASGPDPFDPKNMTAAQRGRERAQYLSWVKGNPAIQRRKRLEASRAPQPSAPKPPFGPSRRAAATGMQSLGRAALGGAAGMSPLR